MELVSGTAAVNIWKRSFREKISEVNFMTCDGAVSVPFNALFKLFIVFTVVAFHVASWGLCASTAPYQSKSRTSFF
tara:strand:- start:35 stop:262 length:228 start_codon:yes stop_codon:yes gene_type:complete